MKFFIRFSMIAAMLIAGVAVAQEQPATVFWQQHQSMQQIYLAQGQGTLIQRQISRHQMLSHDVSLLMGLRHSQLNPVQDVSQSQVQTTQQRFNEWMLGFAWHGMVETRLWLAHGDDAIQRQYADDTRMMLGVEKTFGF